MSWDDGGPRFLSPGDYFSRRHLPHVDRPGAVVFVTFRLTDSLPKAVLDSLVEQARYWRQELGDSPEARVVLHKRMIGRIDKYLGEAIIAGSGPLHLRHPKAAGIMMKHLNWGVDNSRYLLHRFCIMPNHVHVVLEPLPRDYKYKQYEVTWEGCMLRRAEADDIERHGVEGGNLDRQECLSYWKLSKIMKGLKGVSAREINVELGLKGNFWQDESFDHLIRDGAEYERILSYIDENPVAAGLSPDPESWPYGSKSRIDIPVCPKLG